MENRIFEFERARGIVWVCDIADSSQYLNNNKTAASIEEFIPRFHWTSRAVVDAAGGEFIKWTGDGFLAWFPAALHRDLGFRAATVFNAAWHLTFLLNVTGLQVETDKKFRIRHGVTFEHDALVTKIRSGQVESMDLVGRAVVLAFRLSGVKAQFPGIVTQRELVDAARENASSRIKFKRWQLKADDRLKYFKGEKRGTSSLYLSVERQPRGRTPHGALRAAKKAVASATAPRKQHDTQKDQDLEFASIFLDQMLAGPKWSKATVTEYIRFVREELLASLEAMIPLLEIASDNARDDA